MNIQLFKKLKNENINHVVLSSTIADTPIKEYLKEEKFKVFSCIDSRSVGYVATGISELENAPVVIITENDNDSRNLYPSLTEAYYKKLPIILVTINANFGLDYSVELNDTVIKTVVVDPNNSFDESIVDLSIKNSMPVHVVIQNRMRLCDARYDIRDDLTKINTTNNYIFISNMYSNSNMNENIRSNIAGGSDGIVSYVLGASLSKKYRKYIGVANDDEIMQDLNALGNRFMNDAVAFLVYFKKYHNIIAKYAENLGFNIYYGSTYLNMINSDCKTIVFVERCW